MDSTNIESLGISLAATFFRLDPKTMNSFSLSVVIFFILTNLAHSQGPNDCSNLIQTISYESYALLRDPNALGIAQNVRAAFGDKSWTFYIGRSAKNYLPSESGSSAKRSNLLSIFQMPNSPKVYLWIQEHDRIHSQHKVVEFDIRSYKKTRTVIDPNLNLRLEDLLINQEQGFLILKAVSISSKNSFESRSENISWIASLQDGQLRRTIVHNTHRFGLSAAGRSLLRSMRLQPMPDDILRVSFDSDVFEPGTSKWIRSGLYHISVNTRGIQLIAFDPKTFQISELDAEALAGIVIERSNQTSSQ